MFKNISSKLKITSRKKISFLIFTATSTVALILAILFVGIYYYLGQSRLKKELILEAEEILTSHINYNKERIVYKNDDQGRSIENDLLTDGASAIIYNKNLESIGEFGVFEIKSSLLDLNEEKEHEYKEKVDLAINNQEPTYYTEIDLDDNASYEVLIYPIINSEETIGILTVALPLDFFSSLVNTLISTIIFIVPLSLILNYFIAESISRLTFGPIKALTDEMGLINIMDIDHKVDPEGIPEDELFQLADKYNRMIDRVNEGVAKQKEFISNASHELKSPITRAISSLDVLTLEIKNNKDQKDIAEGIIKVKFDLVELGNIIENMLILASIKNNSAKNIDIDLDKVIRKVIDNYKSQNIIWKETGIKIHFPEDAFNIIINNLLENALKHGSGESIHIHINKGQGGVSIKIVNPIRPGTKIDIKNITERHVLGKYDTKKGYGLGLAIIKDIVEFYSLRIQVVVENDEFVVKISGFSESKKQY